MQQAVLQGLWAVPCAGAGCGVAVWAHCCCALPHVSSVRKAGRCRLDLFSSVIFPEDSFRFCGAG